MTFFRNECVRSVYRGLGFVVVTGEDPVVQFLSGIRHKVEGKELRIVPRDAYLRAAYNLEVNEQWLDMRIHGELQQRTPAALPPKFELCEALREPEHPFDEMEDEVSEGVLFFSTTEQSGDPATSEVATESRRPTAKILP